ncbi:MAG TPA: helix-turn-helix transcriptional regulator [Terriglobales bacterium]|nr:helix-turn-helix transcriptional regulator [Terriglobales bacterium]
MPQEPSENTDALRTDFAAKLGKAIKGMSKKEAAEKLGVTRQMLNRYLKSKSTPGSEIVKRACDEWKLTLSVRGFEFKGGAFDVPSKRRSEPAKAAQMDLLGLLDKLRNDQLEAKIVGREGDSFYVKLRIKVVA